MQLHFDTYKPEYEKAFTTLNLFWLNEFFYVEDHDNEVLTHPTTYIINPGGHILVAKFEENVVGVVALMPIGDGVFELTKMAVDKAYRGKQIGQQLLNFCLSYAKEVEIQELIIYSNRKLANAIHIYHKIGFIEIALEKDNPYERADIKMKLSL